MRVVLPEPLSPITEMLKLNGKHIGEDSKESSKQDLPLPPSLCKLKLRVLQYIRLKQTKLILTAQDNHPQ